MHAHNIKRYLIVHDWQQWLFGVYVRCWGKQAGLWLRLGHVFYVLGDHARFLDFSLAPMQASLEAERRALVLAEVDETLARPLPRRHHKRRRRAAHAVASHADVENAIFVGCVPMRTMEEGRVLIGSGGSGSVTVLRSLD